MAKRNAQNERLKRDYMFFLEQTKRLDERSTDKVRAAILKFEPTHQKAAQPRDCRRDACLGAGFLHLVVQPIRVSLKAQLQRHHLFQEGSPKHSSQFVRKTCRSRSVARRIPICRKIAARCPREVT